jgi:hypothetical protein
LASQRYHVRGKGGKMSADLVFPILYSIGMAICVYAGIMAWEEVKRDAFCKTAALFPGLAAFTVFPVINLLVGAAMIAFILSERGKRNGR